MKREDAIAEIKKLRDRKYRTPRGTRYALTGRDRVLLDYVIQNLIGSGDQIREPRCNCGHLQINHVGGASYCIIAACVCVIYEEHLVGSHGNPSLSEAGRSAQSASAKEETIKFADASAERQGEEKA
jgi:hypothetical protein